MIQKFKEEAVIIRQEEIATDIYSMWLHTDKIAQEAQAGQFIGVYCRDGSRLLPRPISICERDRERGALRIVYRVAGEGTKEFSSYQKGDTAEILGVLGNGYPLEEAEGKTVLLMGGGIGIPPLLELAKELKDVNCKIQIVLGYRDNQLFLKDDLAKYGEVFPATEDGSEGTKGTVLDAVRELKADLIFSCGPLPMLKAVRQYADREQIPAWISLEERMACGVGACLGCVCKTVKEDAHSHVHNARICTDGPVFRADDVDI